MRRVLILSLLVFGACKTDLNPFECTDDGECDLDGKDGHCRPSPIPGSDSRWCAYMGQTCETWSPQAGEGLAGQCVETPIFDASIDVSSPDASPPVPDARPPCDWSEASVLANVNTSSDEGGPSISATGLELYFTRSTDSAPPYGDIYVARRTTTDQPFDPPMLMTEVSTMINEYSPFISPNGLELWFWRVSQFFVVTRLTVASAWAPQADPTGIYASRSPSMTDDMLDFYYIYTCPAPGTGPCIFRRHRNATGDPWGDPTVVPFPVDVQYNHVHVSADGLGILLSDPFSATTMRVAESWKANRDDEWTTLTAIDSLSSDSSFGSARWSHDGTEIYLSGDHIFGPGGTDILVARCQ